MINKNLTGANDDYNGSSPTPKQGSHGASASPQQRRRPSLQALWKMINEDKGSSSSKDDTDTPLDKETLFLRSSLEDIDEIFTSVSGLDDLWNSDEAADLPSSSQESIRQMIRDLITAEQREVSDVQPAAKKVETSSSAADIADEKKPSKNQQPDEQVASIRHHLAMGHNKIADQPSSSSSADSTELSKKKKRHGNFSVSGDSSGYNRESNESPEEDSNEYAEDSWSSSGSASSDRSTSSTDRSSSRKKRRRSPEEKELLLDFGPGTEGEKVGEGLLHFRPKVTSESEQADGRSSDSGPTSSSDDPASSEYGAQPSKKHHLEQDNVHVSTKKKRCCDDTKGLVNQ